MAAKPELSQLELKAYHDKGKTMIWQYRTLYQIDYSQAQEIFYLRKVLRKPKVAGNNVTLPGRFFAMTPEHAQRFL